MSESEQDTRDYETEARADGWVAPGEPGAPVNAVDAKTFVERGENILPIVNAKLRKAMETVNQLSAKVADLEDGNRKFGEFHEQALTKAKREREQAVADLEAVRKKAVSEGDGEAFAVADRQLKELDRSPPEQPKIHPDMQAWISENSWYTTDRELAAIADGLSDVVAAENPHLKGQGRAFLDKLTERVKTAVPHKFSNARRDTSLTEDNGNRPQRKKERTYDSLPDDAKKACDKFCRTIPGFTKEKYLAEYQWSQQ